MEWDKSWRFNDRNFIYVHPDANLKECAQTMIKKRVGSLIIKNGDKLKGASDWERYYLGNCKKNQEKDLKGIKAEDLMRRKIVTIKPSADIISAIQKFKKKKVRRLPVVENGKLIGIITANDILRIDPGLFQMIAETIKIREETEKLNRSQIDVPRKQGACEECGDSDMLYYDEPQWLCELCYTKR